MKRKALILAYSDIRFDPRILKQCNALTEAGYSVNYFGVSFTDDPKAELEELDFKVNLLFKRGSGKALQLLEYLFLMFVFLVVQLKYLRSCYIVIVHNMPNFLVLSTLPLRMLGAKVLLDIHDDAILVASKTTTNKMALKIFNMLDNWLSLRVPHSLMTVNNDLKRKLSDLTKKDIKVIHNCPDINTASRDTCGSDNERMRLVYIGHVGTHYGLAGLLEKVKVVSEGYDISLDIYGDGEALESLKLIADELMLSETVSFKGRYSVADLPEILQQYDFGVALYPKNELTDMLLPVKILEYTINNLPVISTRLRVTEEYFGEGSLIWVDEDNSFEEVIERISNKKIDPITFLDNAHKIVDPMKWENEKLEFLRWVEKSV